IPVVPAERPASRAQAGLRPHGRGRGRGAAARAAHPVAGRAAMTAESPAVTQPPATLLRVEGLACHFGGVLAVQDATFDVRRGTITGLIGPNGADKSTVINLISGVASPTRGSVRFDGREIVGQRPHVVARHGIVRTFQQANVFGGLTVLENLLVGAAPWRGERITAALGRKRAWSGRQTELIDLAWDVLRRFGLEDIANDYARALSGGQRRLVQLTRGPGTAQWPPPGLVRGFGGGSWGPRGPGCPSQSCCCGPSRWPASARRSRC